MVVRTIKDTTNVSFVKIAPFTSTPYTKIAKRDFSCIYQNYFVILQPNSIYQTIMAHIFFPTTTFDPATTLCIQNTLCGRFRDFYEYVADVCNASEHTEKLNPAEITYHVCYALDTIAQVRQLTTLHPTHLLFIKRRLSLELELMSLYHNYSFDELIEIILETVLCIITQLLAKVVGLDINEMHTVMEVCNGNPSHSFIYTIHFDLVNKIEELTNNKAELIDFVKDFITKSEYRTYVPDLKFEIHKTYAKNQFTTSSYIDLSTIVDSITPANLQHIDIIKSFLSDVIDESNVDNEFKVKARKQLKEKVDQIKSTRLTAEHVNFYEKVDNVLINNKNNDK